MLKVLACCVNGSGVGLMMKMSIKKAISSLDIDSEIDYARLEDGKKIALNYDIIFCPVYFTDSFDDAKEKGVKVIGLKNLMSQSEIKDRLKEILHSEDK